MTNAKKIVVIAALVSVGAAGAFAAGASESAEKAVAKPAVVQSTWENKGEDPYLPKLVPLNDAAKALFVKKGIDAKYLVTDATRIPLSVREDIDKAYKLIKDDIDPIVYAELTSNIKKGEVEYAYTVLGHRRWIVETPK